MSTEDIERRRKMFHWFIDGWGYHFDIHNRLSVFPNHGISWKLYDSLTPDWVTKNYNVNL